MADSKYRLSFRRCESLRQAGSSSSAAVLDCCSAMHVEVRSYIIQSCSVYISIYTYSHEKQQLYIISSDI